ALVPRRLLRSVRARDGRRAVCVRALLRNRFQRAGPGVDPRQWLLSRRRDVRLGRLHRGAARPRRRAWGRSDHRALRARRGRPARVAAPGAGGAPARVRPAKRRRRGGQRPELTALATMPERPTLTDFIRFRGTPGIGNHILQSANDALRKGESEETVLACLLHDFVLNLMKTDHGWWGAQLMEPYVSEKVSWAIRHHQALRFYPDSSVGYEYPELYVRIF